MDQIKDLDLLKDINILYENQIILYGAGNYGKKSLKLLQELEISILGFGDSNIAKWGENIEGYKVMDINELSEKVKEDKVIIIISMENPDNVEQVLWVLNKYGMQKTACYTYFALKFTIELHINDKRIKESYRTELQLRKKIYYDKLLSERKWVIQNALGNIIFQEGAVLVLNPAKVGSSSVSRCIENTSIPCQHMHSITGRWNTPADEVCQEIQLLKRAEKIRIISLIREPISRDISLYFQSFKEYIMSVMQPGDIIVQADTHKGIKDFLKRESEEGLYGAMFEWFNMEIKAPFGIEVLEYDFDREKGYQIIRKDNVELLLIKMERLDDCEDVIRKFTGAQRFRLTRSNIAHNRLYRFAYEEIKRTIEIPKSILDFYYKENEAVDHFYTEAEKEQFIKIWSKSCK